MLGIDLHIRIGQQYSSTKGLERMGDWADDVLRKLQQKRAVEHIRDEKFVEQQRIKRAKGVPLWNDVKGKIKARVYALKEKSGEDILVIQSDQPNEITVRNEVADGLLLLVKFSPESNAIEWSCGNEDKNGWELVVADDGRAVFHWGMVPTTPDSIAHQMLNALLGI
jgi:hypothetical protein